jgi:Ran GTPase-activating protein (RanGAP) involved in mRNA processing and transport
MVDDENGMRIYNLEGPSAIATAIRRSASLTSIDLSCNQIGPDGGKAIGDATCDSASLTSIDLCDNFIGNKGAKHITENIRTSLTSIDLACNEICGNLNDDLDDGLGSGYDEDGTVGIVHAIASLTNIDLSRNYLFVYGAQKIAKAIAKSASLTQVLAF